MADEDTRAMAATHKQMKKILFAGLHKEWVFHTLYEGGKITINTIKGDAFIIDANYTDTIADLKVRVGVALKRPVGQLYSGSLLLDDHRTLFSLPYSHWVHLATCDTRRRRSRTNATYNPTAFRPTY